MAPSVMLLGGGPSTSDNAAPLLVRFLALLRRKGHSGILLSHGDRGRPDAPRTTCVPPMRSGQRISLQLICCRTSWLGCGGVISVGGRASARSALKMTVSRNSFQSHNTVESRARSKIELSVEFKCLWIASRADRYARCAIASLPETLSIRAGGLWTREKNSQSESASEGMLSSRQRRLKKPWS